MIVGCVSYHRYRQLGQHLTHTVVEKSTYYGSTKIAPNLSSFLVSYTSLHLREQYAFTSICICMDCDVVAVIHGV